MTKIRGLMGDTSVSMTGKIYARDAPDHRHEEAAILDFSRPRKRVGWVRRTREQTLKTCLTY